MIINLKLSFKELWARNFLLKGDLWFHSKWMLLTNSSLFWNISRLLYFSEMLWKLCEYFLICCGLFPEKPLAVKWRSTFWSASQRYKFKIKRNCEMVHQKIRCDSFVIRFKGNFLLANSVTLVMQLSYLEVELQWKFSTA